MAPLRPIRGLRTCPVIRAQGPVGIMGRGLGRLLTSLRVLCKARAPWDGAGMGGGRLRGVHRDQNSLVAGKGSG